APGSGWFGLFSFAFVPFNGIRRTGGIAAPGQWMAWGFGLLVSCRQRRQGETTVCERQAGLKFWTLFSCFYKSRIVAYA
ncbi:MAG: hypothetical protein LUD83_10135, partial [Clostridiales bacterium]|nr:hypothetical protein [Clostridiales bacterium]